MNTRQRIIIELNHTSETEDLYDKLKSCIISKGDVNLIDEWFSGVIKSLYYTPNKWMLVFEGDEVYNYTFFTNLLYDKTLFVSKDNYSGDDIYFNLIANVELTKKNINCSANVNFTVNHGEYPCDKRLASYFSTVKEWVYPKRKNAIIIPVLEIDWQIFHSINRRKLWIEIFNKFKTK